MYIKQDLVENVSFKPEMQRFLNSSCNATPLHTHRFDFTEVTLSYARESQVVNSWFLLECGVSSRILMSSWRLTTAKRVLSFFPSISTWERLTHCAVFFTVAAYFRFASGGVNRKVRIFCRNQSTMNVRGVRWTYEPNIQSP